MTIETRELLCLSILGYRKPGLSEEAYRDYMINVHAPLVGDLWEKYNFVSWTMTHNNSQTRPLMNRLYDSSFSNIADYDVVVQLVFPDIECFERMKSDPRYRQVVGPDHANFADTKRSRMTIGWITEIMRDGKVIPWRQQQQQQYSYADHGGVSISRGRRTTTNVAGVVGTAV